MKKANKGFTLIELLVVVAIIGILAAVGTVAYQGYTKATQRNATLAQHNKAVKFIYSKKFRLIKSKSFNPYYKKSTAKKIVKIVNTINLKKLKIKTFYNL